MSQLRNGQTRAPVGGVLIFAADGHLLASTGGDGGVLDPPITGLADLEARYTRSDAMPLDLRIRGRYVGVPRAHDGQRVMLVSEPVAAVQQARGPAPALVVSIALFRDEEDPLTMQRALGSVLAHELRTPMTTIFGGADLLAAAGISDAGRQETARVVGVAAERLHRVVEDLVLLVRWAGEAGGEPEPVLLGPIVRAGAARARQRGVPVDVTVPPDLPPVAGSHELAEHLVRDLLDHAVANSPPGARVAIVASAADATIEITVTDEGASRGEAEREHAFDLFASSARQGADPSGANLALVAARRLAEGLGGEVRAEAPERGGAIVVRLPAAVEPSEMTAL